MTAGHSSPISVLYIYALLSTSLISILIGPKIYMASADVIDMGSTVLHLDVASAVNLLVYDALSSVSGAKHGAYWLIFQREDAETIRQW